MTNYGLFVLLLLFHVLGDFYFQTEALSKAKEKSYRHTLSHTLLYGIPFLLLGLLDVSAFPLLFAAVFLHGVVDFVKTALTKEAHRFPLKIREPWVFVLDQLLHVGVLFLLANGSLEGLRFQSLSGGDMSHYLTWSLALLLLVKPANIAFKIFYRSYQPPVEPQDVTLKGAGAQIGSLERILMLLFLSMGSLPALGLIMTAKSIARYDRIAKDPAFAEYYLIGTLYSILITVVLFGLLF